MKRRVKKTWIIIFIISLILTTAIVTFQAANFVKNFDSIVYMEHHRNPVLNAVFLLLIYILKGTGILFVMPIAFVYIFNGLLFNIFFSIILCIIGTALEFTAGYILGYKLGKKKIKFFFEKLRGKNRQLDKLLNKKDHKLFIQIVLLYFLPGIPNDILSIFFGARKTHFPIYIAASLLATLPKALSTTIAGKSIFNPLTPQFIIPISILAVITAIALIWKKIKR